METQAIWYANILLQNHVVKCLQNLLSVGSAWTEPKVTKDDGVDRTPLNQKYHRGYVDSPEMLSYG